ncbi:amino acid ABC transporter permease [Amaricoccus solimangrovi]|uniref:Amino acid ABC transporter permease n=1 Tax=Amaricoccus solimangrovi TaxID=2589815 RepID=A0A501WU01_9RHOB|nr:amino acid ABC transporter permease [Amaricoccus solimangrovi]TPE51614.1 amino acid ABC transporter permease [Amaricoccus solimangrovi]
MIRSSHRAAARNGTDLPVMLPFRLPDRGGPGVSDWAALAGDRRLAPLLAGVLAIWLVTDAALAQMQGDADQTAFQTLVKWTPMMFSGPEGVLGGFLLNIVVSFGAMAIGTVLGLWVGLGQVSRIGLVRGASRLVTQIFRNSPWLVLLFYVMLLMPYRAQVFGHPLVLEGWWKATLALSLPIMANISDIVRGAIASVPTGQWESAESLAFSRRQTIWRIILPQCITRMIPPWMNWYCILTLSTPLISILGISDAMTLTQDALAAENRSEFLIPLYLWLMSWFFLYIYPIALFTRRLERRFATRL